MSFPLVYTIQDMDKVPLWFGLFKLIADLVRYQIIALFTCTSKPIIVRRKARLRAKQVVLRARVSKFIFTP